MGRSDALWTLPPEFAPLAAHLPRYDPISLLPAFALAMPLGLVIVWLRIRWLRWRGRPLPRSIVAPAPLAARSTGDMLPASATAIAAGITEELAFRLFVPLAATVATGNVWFGFALATAAFVALHRYQPWLGRLLVGLTAVAMIALYLSTASLWLAMAVHAAIDIAALVIRPWLARFGR